MLVAPGITDEGCLYASFRSLRYVISPAKPCSIQSENWLNPVGVTAGQAPEKSKPTLVASSFNDFVN